MAGYKLPSPPTAIPMYNKDGKMHPLWISWFNALWYLVR